jgi:cysteine synthase A
VSCATSYPGINSRLLALTEVVGNTPMFAIDFGYRGQTGTVYAKAEHLNLTGSIKDRMALQVIRSAYLSGCLQPGDTIIEATSGNAGIAFAALGRALGHPVAIYMPSWMSQERRHLIRSYGAEICSVTREEGGFLASIQKTRDRAACCDGVFLPRQFENAANVAAHRRGTGREILAQLRSTGLSPDIFVAGVGTGGTVMGTGQALRAACPSVRIHPVEPAESPTLSTGHKVGTHRIQGVSDEFVPDIVELASMDKVIAISDGDSILMAQKLAATLGLGLGISSGCNFLAAVTAAREHSNGPGRPVVATVFPDDNKKYLSTSLMAEEPVRECYLAPEIELLDLRVLPRPNLPALDTPFTSPHPAANSAATASLHLQSD